MNKKDFLVAFWHDVARQNATALKAYFTPSAYVCWHNTNEHFTVEEYCIANCEYPGSWKGEVERIEFAGEIAITVSRIWLTDNSASFHVTSFFAFDGDRIAALDEYWGDDGPAPQWRMDKCLGKSMQTQVTKIS